MLSAHRLRNNSQPKSKDRNLFTFQTTSPRFNNIMLLVLSGNRSSQVTERKFYKFHAGCYSVPMSKKAFTYCSSSSKSFITFGWTPHFLFLAVFFCLSASAPPMRAKYLQIIRKLPYIHLKVYIFYIPSLLGQETAKGPCDVRVKLPPVYYLSTA